MTGRRILSAALIVALAIIGVLWGMQIESHRRMREQAATSRHLSAQLALLEVDNLRLSNLVVQAGTPLADAQLAELENLRLEVQKLRRQTNDVQKLQTEIRKLHDQLSAARNSAGSNAPPTVPPEDVFPRDSWQFAGYDTPEDTLQSVTWAISQGEEDAYLAGLSPDLRNEMQSQLAGGDFGQIGPTELSNATGFRIVDRQSISADEVVYTVYMDGEGDEVDMVLDHTNGVWVVSGQSGSGQSK